MKWTASWVLCCALLALAAAVLLAGALQPQGAIAVTAQAAPTVELASFTWPVAGPAANRPGDTEDQQESN